MGLFDRFRPKSKEVDEFLLQLHNSALLAIVLNENHEWQDNDGSAEALRDYMDRNARETDDMKGATLFQYEEAGLILIPIFTEAGLVNTWLGTKPFDWSGMVAVTQLSMKPGRLFPRFSSAPSHVRVIINPKAPSERLLNAQEMKQLAAL